MKIYGKSMTEELALIEAVTLEETGDDYEASYPGGYPGRWNHISILAELMNEFNELISSVFYECDAQQVITFRPKEEYKICMFSENDYWLTRLNQGYPGAIIISMNSPITKKWLKGWTNEENLLRDLKNVWKDFLLAIEEVGLEQLKENRFCKIFAARIAADAKTVKLKGVEKEFAVIDTIEPKMVADNDNGWQIYADSKEAAISHYKTWTPDFGQAVAIKNSDDKWRCTDRRRIYSGKAASQRKTENRLACEHEAKHNIKTVVEEEISTEEVFSADVWDHRRAIGGLAIEAKAAMEKFFWGRRKHRFVGAINIYTQEVGIFIREESWAKIDRKELEIVFPANHSFYNKWVWRWPLESEANKDEFFSDVKNIWKEFLQRRWARRIEKEKKC